MEVLQVIVDLDLALDATNLTWAHGILLGLTCISLLAVTVKKWFIWKNDHKKSNRLNLVKTQAPFSFEIETPNKIKVVSSVPSVVEIYWDFHSKAFKKAVLQSWNGMTSSTMDPRFSSAHVRHELQPGEFTYSLDSVEEFVHSVPRPFYPVGIVIRRTEASTKLKEIRGMIVLVDLGDTSTRRGAKVYGHFIKLYCGEVMNLERFFASGLCQDDIADLCVVCRDSAVTRVVLPCRHACFCNSCFDRVDNCSMCTAEIKSYFVVEPVITQQSDSTL